MAEEAAGAVPAAALKGDNRVADSINDIEYDAKLSINYHRKRESFYRVLDASSKAVSLIALASIGFDVNAYTTAAAVVSGLFTIATIVLDCSGMAGRHGGLAAQFTNLLSKAVIAPEDDAKKLRYEYHVIEAKEPPQLRGLVQLCQDEQDAAEGKDVKPECLAMKRRILAQFGFGQRHIDYKHSGSAA